MADNPRSRSIVLEIEIKAPIDAVWRALTEAEEVTKWLCVEARVTPEVGGSYWVSWGEGQAGESIIEAWEPGRRLRVRNLPWGAENSSQDDEQGAASTPLVQEYTLESRGEVTVLRLVDSGMPDSPDWDGMYDSKDRGWKLFFYALRHYLEKHRGKSRYNITDMRPIDCSVDEAWKRLTGPEGLAGKGSIEAIPAGSSFSVTASTGDLLEGKVLANLPPKTLILELESLDQALLAATFEGMGSQTYLYLTLGTFGRDPADDAALGERWIALLGRLFPAPAAAQG